MKRTSELPLALTVKQRLAVSAMPWRLLHTSRCG